MREHKIRLTGSRYASLRDHLFRGEREEVAFLFARDKGGDGGLRLRTEAMYLVPESELDYQSAYHVSLTDEGLGRIVKMAWDRRAIPVEVHSHRSSEITAGFSESDFWGFDETVPHVRWRLRGAPYAALVFAPTGFDGLVWFGSDSEVEPLTQLTVDGEAHDATRVSYGRLAGDG